MNFRLLVTLLLVILPLVAPVGESWQVIAVPSMADLRSRSARKEVELVRAILDGLDFFFNWYADQDNIGLLIPAGLIDPLAGIFRGLTGVPPLFAMTPHELTDYVCAYGLASTWMLNELLKQFRRLMKLYAEKPSSRPVVVMFFSCYSVQRILYKWAAGVSSACFRSCLAAEFRPLSYWSRSLGVFRNFSGELMAVTRMPPRLSSKEAPDPCAIAMSERASEVGCNSRGLVVALFESSGREVDHDEIGSVGDASFASGATPGSGGCPRRGKIVTGPRPGEVGKQILFVGLSPEEPAVSPLTPVDSRSPRASSGHRVRFAATAGTADVVDLMLEPLDASPTDVQQLSPGVDLFPSSFCTRDACHTPGTSLSRPPGPPSPLSSIGRSVSMETLALLWKSDELDSDEVLLASDSGR
jgi:hypothetical protein